MQSTTHRRLTLLSLIVGGCSLALAIWFVRAPPTKANLLQPLIREMDNHMETRGHYPTSCVSLVSFSQLTQHVSVYTGGSGQGAMTWEPREVSRHVFTIMVDTNGYEIFLPVGRMKLISFSSFPVWRYDSAKRRWQGGRIHWSYGGSYWSED